MTKQLKVFLFGSENNGWALDQDKELTCRALQRMAIPIHFASLEESEVVHTVWDASLDLLPWDTAVRKVVICHVCTNMFKMFGDPGFVRRRNQVDLWVTQTKEADQAAAQVGIPHVFVPYAFDSILFKPPRLTILERNQLRSNLGIDPNEFVVGNFMRDTLGADLSRPKPEKGADIFVEIVSGLKRRGIPVHVLLAGPRRHWLRECLVRKGIRYTFVGQVMAVDDIKINILPLQDIASLHHLLDLCLITSRHEGGPRAVLEAAASMTPVISTPVGLANDIVHSSYLYSSVDEGIEKAVNIALCGYETGLLKTHARTVNEHHTLQAISSRFDTLYNEVEKLLENKTHLSKSFSRSNTQLSVPCERGFSIRRYIAALRRRPLPGLGIRICLWHEFHKPPYGGGNQFMIALSKGLTELGADVVVNQLDDSVDVHICNALWFNHKLIEKLEAGRQYRIIHRMDGLVHLARGTSDRSIDNRAYEFNRRFATTTVLQSAWCLTQALAFGFEPVRPVIIYNSCDPRLFFCSKGPHLSKRIRLIASSWSDNPLKGTALYKKLEQQLDWKLFDFTFVGRTKEKFEYIKHIPPVSSRKLANILRQHDIYITASRNEACSNALLEALACGLPTLYLNDGGNPELVGFGGLPFEDEKDMLSQLLRLAQSREVFRPCINISSLQDVSMRYLELAKQLIQEELAPKNFPHMSKGCIA